MAHIADTKHRFGTVRRDGYPKALVRFDSTKRAIWIDRARLWPLPPEREVEKPRRGRRPGTGKPATEQPISANARMPPALHARWKASGRSLNAVIVAGLDALGL